MASMMACNYDFFLSPCQPTHPSPTIGIDNAAFDELSLEERLTITQKELEQMKKELRFKESDLEDSKHELKFHAIKNEELMDVINAFRSTSADRSHELMRAKAEQNSELIVQVQNLRDLLSKSGDQIADLQKELAQKSKEGEKLSSEQRTHQRLKVQIKGLVKTLNKIEIQSVDIPSEWINLQWITGGFNNKNEEDSDKTIQDITQKIISMEADRQRLLKESKLYNQTSEGDKEEQILELERKARKMQYDHDELQETNKSLMQQLANREKQVGALEDLFQSINANRKLEAAQAAEASPNRKNSLLNIDDEEDIEDEDDVESVDINSMADDATSGGITVSFEEMFTNIWSSFTGNSATEEVKTPAVENDKDQEISSCFNDSYHTKQVEEELRVASTVELSELKEQYQVLNKDYEAARYQIFDLCAKLEESTIKANSFETKAKMREGLLKDVIDQYKELQMENAASNDRMAQLKQKCATLLELEKERKEELKRREEAAADALAAAGKVLVKAPAPTGNDPPTVTAMGETPTFEMSEHTERMASDEESCVSSSPGFDKNFVIEENKALVSECDRLQHEFDSAIEKINELQKSLEEAQDERKEYQAKHANQSLTIAMLEGEKQTLQDKIVETTTMIVDEQSMNEHEKEEYKSSVLRETKAREKQIQREKELWDVIEQYRKLVDENRCIKEEKAEVEQQKAEVESELELTQKEKFQRRDLVYEYKKMEKAMEEAVMTGEELSKELQQARSEAAVNKEETRGVRKRLAGCHFHYKELQEHYNEILKKNEENERLLAKAEKYEALHNSQADSWVADMESVREKHRLAQENVKSLKNENEKLQQLVNKLRSEQMQVPLVPWSEE